MNYEQKLAETLAAIKSEGRYRVFADLKRHRGAYPNADVFTGGHARPITVWCSNDYLGMGQNPKVIAAMHEALDTVGAGSGGTRNISGTTHYHVELESEIADLHVWRVGRASYAAVLTVVADDPLTPADYRRRVAAIPGLTHVSIEVNRCPHGDCP